MSTEINLEALGFTKEELQERVIERICAQVMAGVAYDEDGNELPTESKFARTLNDLVSARVDTAINAIADKFVLPNVSQYIENISLQETNKWGEKRGKPVSFVEYLVARAENYLTEEVNHEGKEKARCDPYSWKPTQTRISHMVHQHLHYHIETAMKQAMKEANSKITEGIEQTVKLKLAEISKTLKVST